MEKWKSEIEQAISQWNTVFHDTREYNDFFIFVWNSGFLILTPEKLSQRNKTKLERLKLFNKWN